MKRKLLNILKLIFGIGILAFLEDVLFYAAILLLILGKIPEAGFMTVMAFYWKLSDIADSMSALKRKFGKNPMVVNVNAIVKEEE